MIGSLFCMITNVADAGDICPRENCLRAHDINGIRLDMTVQQVSELVPNGLTPLGGGQFNADIGMTSYNFEFSPLGHLFIINSSQQLTSFAPDREFGFALTKKLETKYGPPDSNQLPGGPASWGYLEYYTTNQGMRLARETESLSVMLMDHYQKPVTLEMKLMDFRILRRDEDALNRAPKSEAQSLVQF